MKSNAKLRSQEHKKLGVHTTCKYSSQFCMADQRLATDDSAKRPIDPAQSRPWRIVKRAKRAEHRSLQRTNSHTLGSHLPSLKRLPYLCSCEIKHKRSHIIETFERESRTSGFPRNSCTAFFSISIIANPPIQRKSEIK